MITKADIFKRREEIIEVARRNGASDIRIFGSVARDDTVETSDLDLIVRFEPSSSLMDYGMLVEELQELLGVNVDVVGEGGMDDRFRNYVMKEVVPL